MALSKRPAVTSFPAQGPSCLVLVAVSVSPSSSTRSDSSLLPLAGLDAGKLKQVGVVCGQESTRRIGDYKVKYGYSDIDLLR